MSNYQSFIEDTDVKKQSIISIIKNFSRLPPDERAKKEIELDQLFTNLEETISRAENDQALLDDTPPEEKDTFLKTLKKEIHKLKADHNRMSRRLSERTILFGQTPVMENEVPPSPTREKKSRKQAYDVETLQELNGSDTCVDPTEIQEEDDIITKIFGKGKKRAIIISAIIVVLLIIVLAFILYAVLTK